MTSPSVVVIDKERANLDLIQGVLAGGPYTVFAYDNARDALQNMESHGAAILFTDLQMPELDGFKILQIVRGRWPGCKVVIFAGYGRVQDAVRAIKDGATDFLTKPLNTAAFPEMVTQLLALQNTSGEHSGLALPQMEATAESNSILVTAGAAAPTDCTVLITGETGVGKEVLADFIQTHSKRKAQPYIKVNCAALSESLIESELFGHEQGAFTGAGKRHTGRFERAHRGTLFLDEIGELSASMQTKLLRVLQTREVERVGGTERLGVDFRLICATHRNLEVMLKDGKFRQDLYYRINVMPINIQPLRERQTEIPALAAVFLNRARTTLQRGPTSIEPDALALLQSYG